MKNDYKPSEDALARYRDMAERGIEFGDIMLNRGKTHENKLSREEEICERIRKMGITPAPHYVKIKCIENGKEKERYVPEDELNTEHDENDEECNVVSPLEKAECDTGSAFIDTRTEFEKKYDL